MKLSKVLNRLIDEPDYFSAVKQKVSSDQKKWLPVLDGKSGEKIAALIN